MHLGERRKILNYATIPNKIPRPSRVVPVRRLGGPQIPSPPTPPLVLLLPRRCPWARPGKALSSPAAAGTRCPPAREELARAGAPRAGVWRAAGRHDGAGGAPAIPFPMAGGFKIWGATVARNSGGVTRSAAARPDLGSGVSLVSGSQSRDGECDTSAAGWIYGIPSLSGP